jgi:hypothetical protein
MMELQWTPLNGITLGLGLGGRRRVNIGTPWFKKNAIISKIVFLPKSLEKMFRSLSNQDLYAS